MSSQRFTLTILDTRLTELDTSFTIYRVESPEQHLQVMRRDLMAQTSGGLSKFYRNRSCGVGWTVLLVLQKMLLIFLAVMLLVPLFIVLSAELTLRAYGQIPASASSSVPGQPDLPDAPSAAAHPQTSQPLNPFIPGFGQPLHPMDLGDKFKYFVEPAFGPRALFVTAFTSGIRMANPPSHYPREWHSGAEAYGRLYGDTFARNGAESLGRFSTSVLLHEDPRYRRSSSTFVPARLTHALAFAFVDRTDGGHPTLAISNFTGAAASGFIGNAYLPAGFDNLTHAGQRSTIAFGGIAGQNVMQEFAPDLSHLLKKIHVSHLPMPPVWWIGDR
jgi:hypothetical protein